MKTSILIRLAILLPLLGSVAACTALTREIEQVDEQTAELTTQIKSALITDERVDAAAILISRQDDGSIVLSGFVASEQEREVAMDVSRSAAPQARLVDELELR